MWFRLECRVEAINSEINRNLLDRFRCYFRSKNNTSIFNPCEKLFMRKHHAQLLLSQTLW